MQIAILDIEAINNHYILWYPEIVITMESWIHTSRGCGGGGGRLAILAALCLSTSRACLRAFVRLGEEKNQNTYIPTQKEREEKTEGK